MRAGWIGTIRDFLIGDREAWVESLENHIQSSLGETASQANRAAWLNSLQALASRIYRHIEVPKHFRPGTWSLFHARFAVCGELPRPDWLQTDRERKKC
jgi:hypothetical protein